MRDRTRSSAVRAGTVVSALLVGLVVTAGPASAATAAPWRQGDYGAARSSFNSNETVVGAASVAHVAFARSRTAPPVDPALPGCGGGVATKPVVVDHRMFVVLTGRLVAVDVTNGHTLWTVPLDTSLATLYPDLAVVGSRVILARLDCISQSDPSGSVTAYDVATGAQAWNQFFDPGPQSMVVWNNHVLFTGFEAGGGGDLVSLSASTGALQWQYAPGFCDGMRGPVVVGNVVLAVGCDAAFNAQLEGHRLSDGALLWHRPGTWDLQRGDNAAAGGRNAFAVNESTGALTDLNPLTGATRWARPGMGDALAVDGSRVYTDCGSDTLCALRLTNGSTAWSTAELGIAGHPVAVANGLVFSGGGFDTIVRASNGTAVDDLFGEPLAIWSNPVSTIAVANGRIVVSGGRIVDVYAVPGAT